MIAAAAWMLAGNLAIQLLPALPPRWGGWLLLAAGVLALAVWRRPPALALAAAGLTSLVAISAVDRKLAEEFLRHDVRVVVQVVDFPRHQAARVRFTARVLEAPDHVPGRLRLSWYGRDLALDPGDALDMTVRLSPPRGFVNPGGGDYEGWLFRERIGATGYVRAVHSRPDAPPPPVLALRAALSQHVDTLVPEGREAAVIRAVTLGIRDGLAAADRDVLARTGTSHLVAISGLHVGLVAALGLVAVRMLWAWLPGPCRRVAPLVAGAWAGLALAAGYAMFAGFAVPTRRALLMLTVVLVAVVLRRPLRPGRGLALALMVVLVADPLASLDASFWLSFTAVAVIALAVGGRVDPAAVARPRWRRLVRGTLAFVVLQVLIMLGMASATGVLFGQVPLASPLANLVFVPLFSLVVVPVGLVSTALAVPWPAAASMGFALCHAALASAWPLLEALAGQRWAVLSLPARPWPWWLVAAAASVLLLLPRGWPARLLAVPLLAAMLAWRPPAPPPGGFELVVLEVGHGLALWVRTHRHVLVFDTGPAWADGFDAGRSVLVPALRARGITRVDRLVISHEHNDHYGGAAALIDALPVARIDAGGTYARELDAAGPCTAGERWAWDGVRFEYLHPPGTHWTGNDGSCVLSIRGDGVSALLTGDIEARGEARLVAGGLLEPHDVVQVPHHGSATSSAPAFIAATAPAVAVAGTGWANRWGLPDPAVVARWHASGATFVHTAEAGAVEIALVPGAEVSVSRRWRERHRRYWHQQ